jgi:hypothetical protein
MEMVWVVRYPTPPVRAKQTQREGPVQSKSQPDSQVVPIGKVIYNPGRLDFWKKRKGLPFAFLFEPILLEIWKVGQCFSRIRRPFNQY